MANKALSLINIANFEQQIARMDERDESFIRGFLADVTIDGPQGVLREMALAVLNYRKRELIQESEGN